MVFTNDNLKKCEAKSAQKILEEKRAISANIIDEQMKIMENEAVKMGANCSSVINYTEEAIKYAMKYY